MFCACSHFTEDSPRSRGATRNKDITHPTQIGTWKRAAIENMATAFTRRGAAPEQVSAADVDKLHSVNRQVIACNH